MFHVAVSVLCITSRMLPAGVHLVMNQEPGNLARASSLDHVEVKILSRAIVIITLNCRKCDAQSFLHFGTAELGELSICREVSFQIKNLDFIAGVNRFTPSGSLRDECSGGC